MAILGEPNLTIEPLFLKFNYTIKKWWLTINQTMSYKVWSYRQDSQSVKLLEQ
jgi:hypothetical protein